MSDYNTQDKLLRKLSDAGESLDEADSSGDQLDLVALFARRQKKLSAIGHLGERMEECRRAGIAEDLILETAGVETDPTAESDGLE